MTIRVWKLNWKNLNYLDHDVSSLDYALVNQGIIEWMNVTTGFVEVGCALVAVTRTTTTPHQKFLVHVEILTRESVDSSWNKKIWIEVNKNYVNDGTLATNPNGTEIARIMTGANYPWNDVFYLPLASINNGIISDERCFISQKPITTKIPDKRYEKMKTPKELEQEFTNYEFRPINTWEVWEVLISWEPGWWAVAQTICAWTWNDWNYDRQIAYRVHPRNIQSIYMRSALDTGEWWTWEKIFPVSASSIDIKWLYNCTDAVSHIWNEFLFWNSASKINEKVTIENLRKWIYWVSKWINHQYQYSYDWTTNSVAIQRWGIWNYSCGSIYNNNTYRVEIQFSTDNFNWQNIYDGYPYQNCSLTWLIWDWGFVRCVVSGVWNTYPKTFTVQPF